MTPVRDNTLGALCVFVTIIAIVGITWIAHEADSVVNATRVAHDGTRAELADTYSELATTLVELHKCENKPTN